MAGRFKLAACPECGKRLPWGETFRQGFGLRDKRTLDCPYCGAPLEPLHWTDLIPLFAILAIGIAGKALAGPLLDWRAIAVLLVLAAVYHAVELYARRRPPRR